jgi:hypothetical protein
MTNAFDLSCPQCGSADSLDIQASVWVRLTGNGTDADLSHDGCHHWESTSFFQCCDCATSGRVSDLKEGVAP